MKKILIHIYFLFILINSYSQDLSSFNKKEPLKISGATSLTTGIYKVEGMESRMSPYFWMLNLNLNFNFFGIVDAPFSAQFSKNNRTYNQPDFNQIGISPKYKYITAHMGYRSMSFSGYSLSGITFLGGGIEVQPPQSIVKFSGMYGKFAKAVTYNSEYQQYSDNNIFNTPGFERWGYGAKLTVGKQKHNVDLIMFHAADNPNSIPDPGLESGLKPKENLVMGIVSNNKITDRITFNAEYTLSALSTDIRIPERQMETFSYANNLGNLFRPRYSSSYNDAIVTTISYSAEKFSIGGSYKRVDPEYQSLGTTFLSNDLEDYLLNISKNLFKNKISLSGSFGTQRNNLNNSLESTNNRFISSVNMNYNINKNLNVSTNYSNFNSNVMPGSISIRDTFHFAQVTDNMGFMLNYNFGKEKIRNGISWNNTYQTVNTLNETATQVQEIGTKVVNTNLAYTMDFVPVSFAVTTSFNYNYFTQSDMLNSSYGPTLGLNKSLLKKKMRISSSYSVLENNMGESSTALLQVLRLSFSYKINKNNSLSFTNSLLRKKSILLNESKLIKEYKGSISYNYTF